MLAAPGGEGLAKLTSEFGKSFLTAMPVAMMRQIATALPEETLSSGIPKWVQVALGTDENLTIALAADGSTRVVSGAAGLRPNERELARGSRRDFDDILQEGERILREKHWAKIFGDERPFVKKGDVGWLEYASDPEGAAAMEELIMLARNAQK
jgi:hypothetical protein